MEAQQSSAINYICFNSRLWNPGDEMKTEERKCKVKENSR
jgi:hypothetical protein